jgi:hypothetical protein
VLQEGMNRIPNKRRGYTLSKPDRKRFMTINFPDPGTQPESGGRSVYFLLLEDKIQEKKQEKHWILRGLKNPDFFFEL